MPSFLNIVMAQLDFMVGDIDGNTSKIIETVERVRNTMAADLIVFPELTICGYPPEDLLLRPSLIVRSEKALTQLGVVKDIDLIIGVAAIGSYGLENQAVVIRAGNVICRYGKKYLPNYQVFDERRYFSPGKDLGLFECKGVKISLSICEDLWHPAPIQESKKAEADLIISLNASPFHRDKIYVRHDMVRKRCRETGLPVIYTNLVGGQDELVFDGGSFAMNGSGELMVEACYFNEELCPIQFDIASGKLLAGAKAERPNIHARVYQALVAGVKGYVNKNGFKGIVLGLSGGVDSGLTLAIASDALGPERVQAVMMPYRYTSEMSLEDAEEEAALLGVDYKVLPIDIIFNAFTKTLRNEFQGYGKDATEENLQSRSRGTVLMAISNKKGYLVLTTGNKSEISVGYSTLYGDMAGGFNVLKDVSKTLVFELAKYRNSIGYVIPSRVIGRPPSAELAPGQVDGDSLPPYEELDGILELYIEKDNSADDIVAKGYDRETVYRILRLVDINEFKRRQAPVGVRITPRGFGRDRRYPITNGWKLGA
ncbi:MAG: NAD+ synthase [Candidatus Endonucleobacter sp. (ex Gigantidas childressi)]|nr:NAD+ synthase [Candidatus Endonucleobacter sp. (ex Gigantidas childressi)]